MTRLKAFLRLKNEIHAYAKCVALSVRVQSLVERRTDKSDVNDLQDNMAVRDKAIGLLLFACLGFDAYNAVIGII